MASKAKPTGTARNTTANKKPATIDLDAKEIKAEAQTPDTSSVSKSASDKNETFGRPKEEKPADNKPSAETASAKSDTTKTEAKTSTPAKKPAAAKEVTTKETPPPKPVKSSGSFFGKLTSALMGGVAALVGFGAIGLWEGARELPIIGTFYGGSQTSSFDPAELDALKAEIATLKQNASEPEVVDLTPINEKIASLETSLTKISETAGATTALSEQVAKLEGDFTAVNTSIAEITAAAADGSNSSPAALSTAISSLDKRLESLEADLGSVADSVTKNPTLDAVSGSVTSLQAQVQGIATSLTALKQSSDTNTQNLAGLTEQSASLETTVASVKANEKVARSVAVNALATALENDDPLSLPISSIKALVGETPETSRLEALNAQGIPSNKDLVTGLDSFTSTVRNPNAPPESGSISDRFWANAQNMVSFRASGPREGDDALSILSRVKANTENGNLVGAKSEWEKLPAEVSEKGASWLAKLNARIEAFALQNALNQKLTAEAG